MAALNEFDVIQTFFHRAAPEGYVGVGDDCALFSVRPGYQLAVSTDTLIEGQHFFSDVDPYDLGHKSLAVSLSDLCAMGAEPKACVLALALPRVDPQWLQAFSSGLHALAAQSNCPLIGGDTTRHPYAVTITLTIFGEVPITQALRRDLARAGDDIWITGTLGAADLALRYLSQRLPMDAECLEQTRSALERPLPPYAFAPHLLGHAHAAIDISDGFLQDLSHILTASHCGAQVSWADLPMHPALRGVAPALQQAAVLTGGDVFELCFTAPPTERAYLLDLAAQHQIRLTRIGTVVPEPGLVVVDAAGHALELPAKGGFDHFSA